MLKLVVIDIFGETVYKRFEDVEDFNLEEGWIRTGNEVIDLAEYGDVIAYAYVG